MKKIFYTLLMFVFYAYNINAQTNPSPQSIPYTQNFTTLTGTSPAYPAGWQGWTVSGSLSASFSTSAPNGDQAIAVVANTSTSSHVGDFIGKMGVMSTGSAIKAICLSLNTTSLTSIQVVFDVQTQRTENTRLNQLGLQYRVGTTGTFTNVTGSGYLNQLTPTNVSGTGAVGTANKTITLPAACDNQSVVQIRWIIRDSSGTGNRPGFSIDNISVTGSVLSTPSISVTPTTLSGFTYVESTGPSAFQSFSVNATSLIDNLIIGAPSNYQIDTNSSGSYYDSIYLTPSSGSIASRTIYVRLKSGLLTAGSPYNQSLTVASLSATTQSVALNGTVTPLCIAPALQPTSLNFTTVTYNAISGSFTPTTADAYIVIQSTSPTLSGAPSDGTIYTLGASVFGGTIISLGTSTSFTATSLSFLTHYYYFVFPYNNVACGGGPAYNTTLPLNRDTTTLAGPCILEGFTGTSIPALPSGWNFNLITGTYTSAGNFGLASPAVKLDAAGSQITTSSLSPQMASSISFWMKGQGTMTGSSLLVEGYIGGSWTTIDNITTISTTATTKLYNSSTTPALPVGVSQVRFTYNKVSGNLAFDDVALFCIPMPVCSEPTTQPSSINFTAVTHNSMTINWTGGNGDSSLVVVRQDNPVTVAPLDAIIYNPTTVFGTIGSGRTVAAGQYVVYTGGTNSVSITNLLPSTTYHVAVFEYNLALTPCYLDTIAAFDSQLTSPPPIVITPITIPSFSYVAGSGPSAEGRVNISATGLTPLSGTVNVTSSNPNYELSLTPGTGFTSSLLLSYSAGSLSATAVYIRLVSGLSIGAYNTTITATNNIDTTRYSISGTVNQAPCSNLFFSEYIEGTSNNKYFEVYNASDNTLDMSNYRFLVYANGSLTPTTIDSTITGTILPHTTIVYKNSAAVLYLGAAISTTATFYNGDDALVLFDELQNTAIDIIGRIGEDPGTEWTSAGRSTLDKTLIRKFSVQKGTNVNPTSGFPTLSTEWDTLALNDVSNLGIYRNICCVPVSQTTAVTVCPGDLYVFNGETLTVSGAYLDTLVNYVGCDSFLTLNFTINAPGVGGCPIPPLNDNLCVPSNVTPILTTASPYLAAAFGNINTHVDTFQANNGSSSYQVGEPLSTCTGAATNNKTMWYKFTMPFCSAPQVHISTDDRSYTNFDTRISVYRRSAPFACSSLYTEVACSDNDIYYLNTGATTNSTVVLTPNNITPTTNEYMPGEDLYVQTSGVGVASGNYGLIIDVEPYVPTATAVTAGSATIDWSATSTPTWGSVSGAYIQWRPVGSTSAGTYRYVASPANTTTITGLIPGTAYEYWASYVCGNGGRWWTKKGTFTTTTSCTGTSPVVVSVVSGTPCNRPVVSFDATASGYTSYRVMLRRVGGTNVSTSGAFYSSPSTQTYTTSSLVLGGTYQFWVVAFCGTDRVDSSAITTFTVCSSLRSANPNVTEATDEDQDVAYVLPNGDVVYGVPFNAMDLQIDVTNPNAQEITLGTIDANTYLGRTTVAQEVPVASVGDLVIYPNPATTEATLSYSLTKESTNMNIRIVDAQGKEMLNEMVSNPTMEGTYNINLNNYSAGVYFVKVQAGDYIQTKKLIVNY